MRAIWLAAAALLCSTPASAQPPARGPATSTYTTIDLDRCTQTRRVVEGDSSVWRCPGYRSVPVWVLSGDGRFDVDAGEDNDRFESQAAFNNPPDRIEWRIRGGQPRAIIYRLRLTGDGNEGRTVLGVETIGRRHQWAGCLIAWVDGDVPNANAVARRIADRDNRRFRCGHTEPELVTRRRR
jgi:hypothetical protein